MLREQRLSKRTVADLDQAIDEDRLRERYFLKSGRRGDQIIRVDPD